MEQVFCWIGAEKGKEWGHHKHGHSLLSGDFLFLRVISFALKYVSLPFGLGGASSLLGEVSAFDWANPAFLLPHCFVFRTFLKPGALAQSTDNGTWGWFLLYLHHTIPTWCQTEPPEDTACPCAAWSCHNQWVTGLLILGDSLLGQCVSCPRSKEVGTSSGHPLDILYLQVLKKNTFFSVFRDYDFSLFLGRQKVISFNFLLAGINFEEQWYIEMPYINFVQPEAWL